MGLTCQAGRDGHKAFFRNEGLGVRHTEAWFWRSARKAGCGSGGVSKNKKGGRGPAKEGLQLGLLGEGGKGEVKAVRFRGGPSSPAQKAHEVEDNPRGGGREILSKGLGWTFAIAAELKVRGREERIGGASGRGSLGTNHTGQKSWL